MSGVSAVDVDPGVPEGPIVVEHRRWGLDRGSLVPAAVVLVIGLVLAVLLPMVDRSVADHAVVRAGDRLDLGAGLTLAPPEGWRLVKGVTLGTPTIAPVPGKGKAVVTDGTVTAALQVGPFRGDASQLLDQVNADEEHTTDLPGFRAAGDRAHVTATGDVSGVRETYRATSGAGVLASYALSDGRGLTILVSATDDGQLTTRTDQIQRMLSSVALTTQGDQS